MKTIILDIDGVLADFVWGFTTKSGGMFGKPATPYGNGGQPDWNFSRGSGLSSKQVSAVWEQIKLSPSFWESLPLLATETDLLELHRLERQGINLVYMTGRMGVDAKRQTANWLAHYGFPRGDLRVLEGGSKAAYLGSGYEEPYAPDRSVRGILEDKPGECLDLWTRGWPVFIRDWQYNRHVMGIPRVSSVMEFLCRATG